MVLSIKKEVYMVLSNNNFLDLCHHLLMNFTFCMIQCSEVLVEVSQNLDFVTSLHQVHGWIASSISNFQQPQ